MNRLKKLLCFFIAPVFAASAEPARYEGPLFALQRMLSLPETVSAQATMEELQLSRSPTGRGAPGRPYLVSARKEAKGLVFTVEGDQDGQLQELRTSFFSDEDRQANCSKKSEVLEAVPGLSRIIFDLYTEPVQAKPDNYKAVLPGGVQLGISFAPDKCLSGFSLYRKK